MPGFIDITGMTFGRLSVIEAGERYGSRNKLKWLCRCSCGTTTQICGEHLRSGHTSSCGCKKSIGGRERATKHGGCGTPEYQVWKHMRQRCLNRRDKSYSDYGGRGITICKRWDSFDSFLEDMGPRPSSKHTIERVRVNDGYDSGNCVWIPKNQQSRNTRLTIFVEVEGQTLTLSEAMKKLHMNGSKIKKRYAWTRNGEQAKDKHARA